MTHFLSFALQLDLSSHPYFRSFILSLIAMTPFLNTMTRIFCDPSLKQKLMCWRRLKNDSVIDSFLQTGQDPRLMP